MTLQLPFTTHLYLCYLGSFVYLLRLFTLFGWLLRYTVYGSYAFTFILPFNPDYHLYIIVHTRYTVTHRCHLHFILLWTHCYYCTFYWLVCHFVGLRILRVWFAFGSLHVYCLYVVWLLPVCVGPQVIAVVTFVTPFTTLPVALLRLPVARLRCLRCLATPHVTVCYVADDR